MYTLFPIRKRKKNVKIGAFSAITKQTFFEGSNRIGCFTSFKSSKIGFASYIGNNCRLSKVKVGRFCSIGSNVQVVSGKHPVHECISTHPAFFSTNKANTVLYTEEQAFKENNIIEDSWSVVIGNDVWIGNNVLILEGVRVGDGAIIACGSVVTKDVDNYSVVAGVPAKQKKNRFSDEQIAVLNNLKWWDWPQEKIKNNSRLFNSPSLFIDHFSKIENDE